MFLRMQIESECLGRCDFGFGFPTESTGGAVEAERLVGKGRGHDEHADYGGRPWHIVFLSGIKKRIDSIVGIDGKDGEPANHT